MSNTEIVVVGAGVAGLSAALAVAGTGHDVTLVTKAELVESNTYHAQGGIAAAIFSDDDPKLHAADTMAAGHGLCDPKAVDILTREGAERVREFAAAGVHFDRDAHGHMLRGLEAAHSRARVVHAGGDATGKVFELDVSAMVRKNPRIHIIENAFLKDLIVRGGHIAGVHLLIDGQDKDLAADRVILAAGGAGRMYPYTTNPPVATADGLAVAWRAGAQVADLEFYQFHPTAMAVGEHFLVSEAVRGEGAVLLDEHGHRYMKDIDPRAELAPRDVVARENFRVMQAQGGKPVMLDVSPMARENPDLASFLAHRFPTIDAYTRSLGFDWSKEPIPVAPAAHYYMGGIRTDLNARTSIPGLYAAGECARTGVMGSNRLASNSLLEGLVYGRRAGLAAVADGDDAVWAPEPFLNSATGAVFDHAPIALAAPAATAAADDTAADKVWNRTRIQNTMWHGVGVLRDEAGLKTAIAELGQGLAAANAQADVNADGAASSVEAWENRNMLTVGYVAATAALARTESRGAHARTDPASQSTTGPTPSPTSRTDPCSHHTSSASPSKRRSPKDAPYGDITCETTIPADETGSAHLTARENGVMSGIDVFRRSLRRAEPGRHCHRCHQGRRAIPARQILATVKGPVRDLLTAERIALNFTQRMSGIATMTAAFVDAVNAIYGDDYDGPGHPAAPLRAHPHRRYAQNHARPAPVREIRRGLRRRPQPSLRTVRRGHDEGQPSGGARRARHRPPARSATCANRWATPRISKWKSTALTRFCRARRRSGHHHAG